MVDYITGFITVAGFVWPMYLILVFFITVLVFIVISFFAATTVVKESASLWVKFIIVAVIVGLSGTIGSFVSNEILWLMIQ